MKLLYSLLRKTLPTGKLLTGAGFASSWYGNSYDATMVNDLDWWSLMTYDFAGSWVESPIGPPSSLKKVPGGYKG